MYTVKPNDKCPWKNKKLQSLKNKKNKEWNRYKTTDDYVQKMTTRLKSDPSSFWQYVNAKRSTNNQPKSMQYGDIKSNDETEQADLFANFFGANYSTDTTTETSQPSQLTSNVDIFELSFTIVCAELEKSILKKVSDPMAFIRLF